MRRQAVKLLLAGVVAITAATVVTGLKGWQLVNGELDIPIEGAWLEVNPGASLAAVSRELAARGLLRSARVLTYFGRIRGDATRIQAGEYRLLPGMSGRDVLDRLVAGDVYLHQLTAVEGWRAADLLSAIRAHPAIEVTGIELDDVMTQLGKPDTHPEGQFAPDTYHFPRGTTDLELLAQAHAAMTAQLDSIWHERSAHAEVETPYAALILASIIEKETALASERREIAGVFNRRLNLGMRLQTDPTVIYGLGAAFDGNLRRADLSRDTPYNTYTRNGLPPTPIALPGMDSLRAAVDPAQGSALYFVASGFGDGSHTFSTTLEEHNRAVASYLARLRARDRE